MAWLTQTFAKKSRTRSSDRGTLPLTCQSARGYLPENRTVLARGSRGICERWEGARKPGSE